MVRYKDWTEHDLWKLWRTTAQVNFKNYKNSGSLESKCKAIMAQSRLSHSTVYTIKTIQGNTQYFTLRRKTFWSDTLTVCNIC